MANKVLTSIVWPTIAVLLMGCMLLAQAPVGVRRETEDAAAIRRTALDFEEGWYEGDAGRMARALHPNFVMRHVGAEPATGKSVLDQDLTAPELIERTAVDEAKCRSSGVATISPFSMSMRTPPAQKSSRGTAWTTCN